MTKHPTLSDKHLSDYLLTDELYVALPELAHIREDAKAAAKQAKKMCCGRGRVLVIPYVDMLFDVLKRNEQDVQVRFKQWLQQRDNVTLGGVTLFYRSSTAKGSKPRRLRF